MIISIGVEKHLTKFNPFMIKTPNNLSIERMYLNIIKTNLTSYSVAKSLKSFL